MGLAIAHVLEQSKNLPVAPAKAGAPWRERRPALLTRRDPSLRWVTIIRPGSQLVSSTCSEAFVGTLEIEATSPRRAAGWSSLLAQSLDPVMRSRSGSSAGFNKAAIDVEEGIGLSKGGR